MISLFLDREAMPRVCNISTRASVDCLQEPAHHTCIYAIAEAYRLPVSLCAIADPDTMLLALYLAVAALLSPVSAATWYFLRYNLPSTQAFLSFSGTMQIPKLPKAGTYYLWPGLQPTDNSGVYDSLRLYLMSCVPRSHHRL